MVVKLTPRHFNYCQKPMPYLIINQHLCCSVKDASGSSIINKLKLEAKLMPGCSQEKEQQNYCCTKVSLDIICLYCSEIFSSLFFSTLSVLSYKRPGKQVYIVLFPIYTNIFPFIPVITFRHSIDHSSYRDTTSKENYNEAIIGKKCCMSILEGG